MRVLIADDSVVVRDRLVAMLSELSGVDVVGVASDTPGAIESLGRLQPDVVVVDIRMPGGSGFDVLNEVKQREPSPVVIMLTNYAYPQHRARAEEAGADFFLDKSEQFERVPELIKELGRRLNTQRGLSLRLRNKV